MLFYVKFDGSLLSNKCPREFFWYPVPFFEGRPSDLRHFKLSKTVFEALNFVKMIFVPKYLVFIIEID